MKCEACNSEIDENAIACPVCGAELDERLLPDIKEFLLKIVRSVDRRVRLAAGFVLVFAIALFLYNLFPGAGKITGRVTWNDGVNEYPIVGARILILKNGSIVGEKVSDEKGRFDLSAPTGDIDFVVADLASVKTGEPSDYTITNRVWMARFWKRRLFVRRGDEINLYLNRGNMSPPEIEYFSKSQLTDYLNRAGWTLKGPFSKEQIEAALAAR